MVGAQSREGALEKADVVLHAPQTAGGFVQLPLQFGDFGLVLSLGLCTCG